jgi:hypothetical protein
VGPGEDDAGRLLAGKFDWLTGDPWRYDESIGIERHTLADDPAVEVVVPPGQERAASLDPGPDLLGDIAAGKYRGIVLVVSYGYHNLTTASYKRHELFAGSKEGFSSRRTPPPDGARSWPSSGTSPRTWRPRPATAGC